MTGLPKRVIEGHSVRRDWYRWFIRLFDGDTIWFYQSDVCGIELVPPYEVFYADSRYSWPLHRTVRLFVEPGASEHTEGTDS